MYLYSYQNIEVIHNLYKDNIYFAAFDKCLYLQDDLSGCFRIPYEWMLEQYNKRFNNEFSAALIWWYTDRAEALEKFKYYPDESVLIKAKVPDKFVLLHDADLWEEGPLLLTSLGFRTTKIFTSSNWNEEDDDFFDKLYGVYKDRNNILALKETWNEVFNIRRTQAFKQRIHAVTPFIALEWLTGRMINGTEE